MKSNLLRKQSSGLPEDPKELFTLALDDYNPQAFLKMVEILSKGQDSWSLTEDLLESIRDDPGQTALYTSMLKDQAVNLAKFARVSPDGNQLSWPLCPSILEYRGEIQTPKELVLQWPLEILLDEYFGICYSPQRDGNRFESGIKEALIQKIRSLSKDPADVLESDNFNVQSGMSVSSLEDLINIYGEKSVKDWRFSKDNDEILQWAENDPFGADGRNYWYQDMVALWGDGIR